MTQIDILLPHKEILTEKNRGAIASVVSNLVLNSASPDGFEVYGVPISSPLKGVSYTPLRFYQQWLYGRNLGLAHAYLRHLNAHNRKPDLIEVHGRAKVAALIARKRPDLKVILYLHNDPHNMRGSKTVGERTYLLSHLAAIVCVSEFVKTCFCKGLDKSVCNTDRLFVIPNGVNRRLTAQPEKKKQILIAGRMVPEKGILEACQAVAKILPEAPDWSLHVIGGRRFADETPTSYEQKIFEVVASLGENAIHHGFCPYEQVRTAQEDAAICIVPSLWEEPAGLTVIEALSAGAALVTTNRGGIPETASGRALIIDISSDTDSVEVISAFAENLSKLLSDDILLRKFQMKAWKNYPFSAQEMAKKADKMRRFLLNSNMK